MSWTWKRWLPCNDAECVEGCTVGPGKYETAETEGLTPPDGDGWVLDGKFAVGKVTGAGDSPGRSSL